MLAAWYFHWSCAGACPDGTSGTDGPFADQATCEQARRDRGWSLQSQPDGTGSASECYDERASAGGSRGSIVQAAVLARLSAGAIYGPPWQIDYANGSQADVGPTTGAEVAITLGHEVIGLQATLGLVHAPGARAVASDPLDPIWAWSVGLGVASSPFAIVERRGLEVRPDFGIEVGDLRRVSCERCELTPARKPEPMSAFQLRVRAGVDVWLTRRRNHGFALEAIYQRGTLGGEYDLDDPDAPVSATLAPPTFMLRLSFLRRGGRFAAE